MIDFILAYDLIFTAALSLMLGAGSMRWYLRRPLPLDVENLSAHNQYQEYKDAKIAARSED